MLRILLVVVAIIAVEADHDITKRFPYNPDLPLPTPGPVAFWPMNTKYYLDDVTSGGNHADGHNVTLVTGKDCKDHHCGAYKFYGSAISYVHFPNNGAYDTRTAITLMAWVCPYGNPGPIFHFDPTGNGVQMWQWASDQAPGALYGRVRFNHRDGTIVAPSDKHIPALYEWYHCAVIYDPATNWGTMYLNGVFTALGVIGPLLLATDHDAQAGAIPGSTDWFDGLITCVQVYDRVLTEEEVCRAAYHPYCVCPGERCDPHLTTLDGRDYSFQGICWYTLIKDCSSANSQFEITADLVPRDYTSDEVKTRAVAINVTVGDESAVVNMNNGATTSHENLQKINIVYDGNMVVLSFKLKDTTFKVFWTGSKHSFTIEFTGDYYRGKMCGLLGDGDGDSKNDFKKPDGVIVEDVKEFGESWKVPGKQC